MSRTINVAIEVLSDAAGPTHYVRPSAAWFETACGMSAVGMVAGMDGVSSALTCEACQLEYAAEFLITEDRPPDPLDALAWDRFGVQRQVGESDTELRDRLRPRSRPR
jgi:hypothetical protein